MVILVVVAGLGTRVPICICLVVASIQMLFPVSRISAALMSGRTCAGVWWAVVDRIILLGAMIWPETPVDMVVIPASPSKTTGGVLDVS